MKPWISRVLQAAGVGVAVFCITAVTAFQLRSDMYVNHKQWWTQQILKDLDKRLQEQVDRHGAPPDTLERLVELDEAAGWGWSDEDAGKRWTDRWRHPLVYTTNGRDYLVTSYGRDGRPGGIGLDADLTTDNPDPPGCRPTVRQFALEMPTTRGFRFTCIAAGVLSGLVVLLQRRPKSAVTARQVAGRLAKTTLIAVFAACYLLLIHIPSGH